jgi:hypothetical protein
MRIVRLLALLCVGLACPVTVPSAEKPPACASTVSGDLRLHQLESRIFGNTRTIRVLLPPGYDARENASRRYPVPAYRRQNLSTLVSAMFPKERS